ncbi:hypothetical protein PP178_10375 [Zeaxanthinibacter sp. PT1]|uniref:hypothetical protein n=1 Tax=Zeaxanthinibacter TaxID=561554 RepID=UPI002349B415|nr:hypothetical protein [Zeaxanthinibacter sp. PT1]MDC6351960.1 hypothetical protein [Zeaxanthinibacter sp. PT1]
MKKFLKWYKIIPILAIFTYIIDLFSMNTIGQILVVGLLVKLHTLCRSSLENDRL